MEKLEEQPPPLPDHDSLPPLPPRWPAILVVMLCWFLAFIIPPMLGALVLISPDEGGEGFTIYDGFPFLFLSLMVFATIGTITFQILIAFRVICFRLRSYFFLLGGFCVASVIIILGTMQFLEPRAIEDRSGAGEIGALSVTLTFPMIALGGIAWLVGIIVKWK